MISSMMLNPTLQFLACLCMYLLLLGVTIWSERLQNAPNTQVEQVMRQGTSGLQNWHYLHSFPAMESLRAGGLSKDAPAACYRRAWLGADDGSSTRDFLKCIWGRILIMVGKIFLHQVASAQPKTTLRCVLQMSSYTFSCRFLTFSDHAWPLFSSDCSYMFLQCVKKMTAVA